MYNDNFRVISISQLAICTKNIIVEKLKTRQKYGNIMNFTCQMLQYINSLPCCLSIRNPSSPKNFLSYAVSIVQKVPSQPKLSRFNL